MEEGDTFVVNDPYQGGSHHVPDVAVATPVLYRGQVIAFTSSIAHKPDVGGMVPGSSSAASREIFHEGLLLFAVTFTSATEMRTLSAGLPYMVGQYEIQWGQLSAGVMISTVPVAVLFTFLQRHLIRGLTAGALKG